MQAGILADKIENIRSNAGSGLSIFIVTFSSIIEDDSGIYWVSTVSGISRIELKETSEGYDFLIVNFSSEDGLQGGKFYENSS